MRKINRLCFCCCSNKRNHTDFLLASCSHFETVTSIDKPVDRKILRILTTCNLYRVAESHLDSSLLHNTSISCLNCEVNSTSIIRLCYESAILTSKCNLSSSINCGNTFETSAIICINFNIC